jgi:hypothetical protein
MACSRVNFTFLSFFRRVRKIAKSDYRLCHICLSVCLSACQSVRPCVCVCPSAWNNFAPTGQIFVKFDICAFFQKLSRILEFNLNLTRITGTLHIDVCTFMIITRWIIFGMRNSSENLCTENQNTHFMFNNFFAENNGVYEIIWKSMVQPNRPQMTIK